MEITLATGGDARSVLALWRDARSLPSTTDDEESVHRVAERGNLLVAVDDGEVIGTLVAAFDGWRGNLYRLAVAEVHRRRGVARWLVEAGEARMRAQGCRRVTALVADSEPEAAAFWRAVGYRPDDRVSRYVKTVGDG